MTVFENVLVGGTYGRKKSEKASHELCARALHRTGLLPRANVLAESLSLLERKRLELARALATEPKVLLLDEIAGGLTEHEVQLAHRDHQAAASRRHQHHLDRAHRPRASGGRGPAHRHRLRPLDRRRRPARPSSTVPRSGTCTWGAWPHEPARTRRASLPATGTFRPCSMSTCASKRGRRTPSSGRTGPGSPRFSAPSAVSSAPTTTRYVSMASRSANCPRTSGWGWGLPTCPRGAGSSRASP